MRSASEQWIAGMRRDARRLLGETTLPLADVTSDNLDPSRSTRFAERLTSDIAASTMTLRLSSPAMRAVARSFAGRLALLPTLRRYAMSRFSLGVLLVACIFVSTANRRGECADPTSPAGAANPQTTPHVVIDAGKTREPISKYIYGQFIEHLGRCIYGGIWAEMLEDRKFFDPVGSKQSPWKAVGPADQVTMDRDKPFVGAHTPKITLPGDGHPAGIVQGELALRRGKQYVGRIWLSGDSNGWPGQGQPGLGRRPGPTADDHDRCGRCRLRENAAAVHRRRRHRRRPPGNHRRRQRFVPRRHGFADAGRQRPRHEGRHAGTAQAARRAGLSLARRQFRQRLQLAGRHRRPRPPSAAQEPRLARHRAQRLRPRRVHGLLPAAGHRALHRRQQRTGRQPQRRRGIEYANAPADRPAANCGRRTAIREPYGVHWWGIGNEMFGDWQLGHMGLEKYIPKHNEFAKAMRAADPSIKLVAVGAAGPWSEGMLRHCADHMDLMSEHFYCGENPNDLVAHVRQIPDNIRRIATAHRQYRKQLDSLKGKDIRIAMDEWNYWYGPDLYGEIGCPYSLEGRPGHRRRFARIRPAERHRLHGQLRPDGQRDRLHQDQQDGGVLRHDRPGAEALPQALRRDARRGRGARAAGRGGRLDRRSQGADDRHRQSDA